MGYDVILACRSRQKGEEAATQINSSKKLGGKAYFLHPLDLSSFSSIRQFVSIFSETHDTLHILINNAGINTTGISHNDDKSFDLCFQTNYLGHYLLTRLLTPYLFQAKNIHYQQQQQQQNNDNDNNDGKKMMVEAGRVVNLSSVTHHFVRPDEKRSNGMEEKGELQEEATMNHDWWKGCATPGVSTNTYKESKLAAILFTQELNKRYSKHGLRAVTVNPGAV